MDIKASTPAVIDAELARIGMLMAEQRRILDEAMDRQARQRAGRIYPGTYDEGELRRTISRAADKMADLEMERQQLNREFELRGGWTRYYLVDSSDGHVHRDLSYRRCSRGPSTTHIWLTEQSGMAAEDLIALAGERACTVCFPDAPVEVLRRPSSFTPPTELERQARAAEREQRAMAKRAKEITDPETGRELVVEYRGFRETPRTVVSAERLALDIEFTALLYGRPMGDDEQVALAKLFAAIAAKKHGCVDVVKTEHQVRLIKKCRREGVRR